MNRSGYLVPQCPQSPPAGPVNVAMLTLPSPLPSALQASTLVSPQSLSRSIVSSMAVTKEKLPANFYFVSSLMSPALSLLPLVSWEWPLLPPAMVPAGRNQPCPGATAFPPLMVPEWQTWRYQMAVGLVTVARTRRLALVQSCTGCTLSPRSPGSYPGPPQVHEDILLGLVCGLFLEDIALSVTGYSPFLRRASLFTCELLVGATNCPSGLATGLE